MYVVSILEAERLENVSKVQLILSKFGNSVSARLGLHNQNEENKGLIIVIYNSENVEEFVEELKKIKTLRVNYMKV